MKSKGVFIIIAGILVNLSLGTTLITYAATFNINNTIDAVDANPGDGICATAGGVCTLRSAIQEANALPGDDTINLPSGTYVLTITGEGEDASATGDLDITSNLTIQGEGSPVINGNGIDRVLHILLNNTVEISNVVIQLGKIGGILNQGTLALNNCSIGYNAGHGIHNGYNDENAILTLNNCVVDGNNAGDGGGIYNRKATVIINNCSISSNNATST